METLRSSFAEISQHALRSVLTLTGIVLGCLALVVMSSVMDGVTGAVSQGFGDLGFDGVFGVVSRAPRTPQERILFAQSEGLRVEDLDALRRRGREIAGVSGRCELPGIFEANGRAFAGRIIGVEPDYRWMRNRQPAEGRFFTEGDVIVGTRACVIGSTLRKRLFGTADAVGQEITVSGVRLRVIGVGRPLGNTWFREGMFRQEMEGVTVPLRTAIRELGGSLQMIEVKAKDAGEVDAAIAEASRILLSRHGMRDFHVENISSEILRARGEGAEQVRNWRIVMLSIAGITLLVGGVGLLSVLLISLAERTYEIGLRKALGATGSSILMLFLTESMLLSLMGATLGIASGAGLTMLAAQFFPDGMPVSMNGVLTSLVAALAVGLLFGIGPSIRAALMQPVECLRERG